MMGMVADINARGLYNWTALHFASNRGHVVVVEELLKQPGIELEGLSTGRRTPLHEASAQGHIKVVQLLLDKNVNVNAQDDEEQTPLHLASKFGTINSIKVLLKHPKIDAFLRNKYGYIASDIAQTIEVRQVFIEYLKELASPVDKQQNKYARTAF